MERKLKCKKKSKVKEIFVFSNMSLLLENMYRSTQETICKTNLLIWKMNELHTSIAVRNSILQEIFLFLFFLSSLITQTKYLSSGMLHLSH